MSKCIILDYNKGEVVIISFDSMAEDIEEVLTELYGYSLGDIEYMVTKDLKLRID